MDSLPLSHQGNLQQPTRCDLIYGTLKSNLSNTELLDHHNRSDQDAPQYRKH